MMVLSYDKKLHDFTQDTFNLFTAVLGSHSETQLVTRNHCESVSDAIPIFSHLI